MSTTSPTERLCSFGGGPARSWTDIFTNHTFIDPIDPVLGVSEILHGRLPAFALPHFLHEATHHTCLSSPVGLAMTALEYRARELAEEEDTLREAWMYSVRVHSLLALYRPLFEGLALFAEFDAQPGGSRVATTPMLLALDLFVREAAAAKDRDTAFDELILLLSRHRLTADVVGRKESLLSEPLATRDGYLVGYLLAKCFGTWSALVAKEFEDSDLALGYAIYHFFYDYELVDLLLEPTVDSAEIKKLIDYAGGRLRYLFSGDGLSERARRFEEELLTLELESESSSALARTGSALDNDPAVVARARNALLERLDALPEEALTEVTRRSLLHLTSIPVSLAIRNRSFIALYDGAPLVVGPLPPSWTPTDDLHGSVDAFYEVVTRTQGVAVSTGGGVIWRDFRSESEELAEWLDQLVVAREHVVTASDRATAEFEEAIARAGLAGVRDSVINGLHPLRQELYESLVFPWIPEQGVADFVRAAGRRGFRTAVGAELIRSLAVLSMLNGIGAYLEEANLIGAASTLAEDSDQIRATLENAFGGTPLLLEPLFENGQDRTRVRAWV
jgi:hypothetical protein